MLIIRSETPEDFSAVRHINESAFGRPAEADLVDALRRAASPFISLVAELDGQVVGHIFFSPVTIESDDSTSIAMGLGPLAIAPEYQNRCIGSELVIEGLRECRRIGHDVVVVLGHAGYYPRFGFRPASSKGLRCEYDVPDDVFMVAELSEGAIGERRGLVKYHPEFSRV